jgi:hypothetical protein
MLNIVLRIVLNLVFVVVVLLHVIVINLGCYGIFIVKLFVQN